MTKISRRLDTVINRLAIKIAATHYNVPSDHPMDGLCAAMKMALERSTQNRQGLHRVNLVNIDTGERTRDAIEIRFGAKQRGIEFNNCPFCAGDISTHSVD